MTILSHRFPWRVLALAGVLTMTLTLAFTSSASAGTELKFYKQTNLVSDLPGAAHRDPLLVNPWGMSSGPVSPARPMGTPFWVSDNGTGVTTLYNVNVSNPQPVVPVPLVVTIPPAGSAPTGQVFNDTSDFLLNGFPSLFIFATEDGTISAWNQHV